MQYHILLLNDYLNQLCLENCITHCVVDCLSSLSEMNELLQFYLELKDDYT